MFADGNRRSDPIWAIIKTEAPKHAPEEKN